MREFGDTVQVGPTLLLAAPTATALTVSTTISGGVVSLVAPSTTFSVRYSETTEMIQPATAITSLQAGMTLVLFGGDTKQRLVVPPAPTSTTLVYASVSVTVYAMTSFPPCRRSSGAAAAFVAGSGETTSRSESTKSFVVTPSSSAPTRSADLSSTNSRKDLFGNSVANAQVYDSTLLPSSTSLLSSRSTSASSQTAPLSTSAARIQLISLYQFLGTGITLFALLTNGPR